MKIIIEPHLNTKQNVLAHVWYASANLYKKSPIFYLMLFQQINSFHIQKIRRLKYQTKCRFKHTKCWFVLHLQNGVSFISNSLAILFQRITSKAAVSRWYSHRISYTLLHVHVGRLKTIVEVTQYTTRFNNRLYYKYFFVRVRSLWPQGTYQNSYSILLIFVKYRGYLVAH